MERTPIDSTNLASVGYDPGSRTLEVEFQGGRVYQYFDVPPTRFRELLQADSAGRVLNTRIKGTYSYAAVH